MKKVFLGIFLVALLCTSCTEVSRYNQSLNVMETDYYFTPLYKCKWKIKGDMPLIDIESPQEVIEHKYYLPERYRVIKE